MAATALRALLLLVPLCASAGVLVGGQWGDGVLLPPVGLGGPGCQGGPQSSQVDICSDCRRLVTLLIRVANASTAEAALEGVLHRECAALPLPSMVTPCRRMVSRYGELLGTQLTPSAICAHLALCPMQPWGVPAAAPRLGALLKDAALPVPLPLCWLCRTFLSRAEAAVPKEAVAKALSQLCRALPAVAAAPCQCLAERYAELLLEALLGRLAPRLLCRLMLACGPEDGGAAGGAPTGRPGDEESGLRSAGGGTDPALWQPLAELPPNLKLSPNLKLPPNLKLSPKPEPCALGPAYWCSSAETAQRCEAQPFCQQRSRL